MIVAVLAAAVLATGVAGWLLLTSAWGSSANGGGIESSSSPSDLSRDSASSSASAATGTTRLQLTSDKQVAASASYSFAEPIAQVSLTVPPQPEAAQDQGFDPTVSSVRVTVEGRPERTVPGTLVGGDSISVPLPAGTTKVRLDYLAEGVVVRSVPSSEGRAVVLLTPLAVTSAAETTNLVVIRDSGVLNLGCETAGSAMTACGLETDAGWQVALNSGTGPTRVLAGVDLTEE